MSADASTASPDPLWPRVLAWLHGHGPTPDQAHPGRPVFDGIHALRHEHALALETVARRPSPPRVTLPEAVRLALLDPQWVDVRQLDVVYHEEGVPHRVVAFDPATDRLILWRADDPADVVAWPGARCADDAALCAALRVGRAARFPWDYPTHVAPDVERSSAP